eukprot:TRINITY_DN7993_c0_g1_i1.p1 TRINITY_DN7993_c0_g1~~TRINITY_DN7993_c0_g1_i1.p1  ORF type:complete len:452 (+),score=140.47 TRINITY_DN7993_c0_g1_i1:83-1438(+)
MAGPGSVDSTADDEAPLITAEDQRKPLLNVAAGNTPTGDPTEAEASSPAPELTLFSATVGVAQNILGCGVLALPYAMRSGGYIGAPVLLAVVLGLSLFTMFVLPALSDELGVFSFKEIALRVGNQRLGIAVETLILCYNLGLNVGYCVFVGDFVRDLIGDHIGGWEISRRMGTVIVTVAFFFPLACARNLSFLAPFTVVGVAGIIFATAAVIVRYSDGRYEDESNPGWPVHLSAFDSGNIAKTFPILVVSYGIHFNCLRFYYELRERSQARMRKVICGAIGLSTLVYATVGMIVYATFGRCTESDFTGNFDSADVWIGVVRVAMLIALINSYPLVALSARRAVDQLFMQPRGWEMTPPRRVLVTTLITVVCLGIATLANDPGVVLDYNGSVFGTPVCYIIPPVFYLLLPRSSQSVRMRAGCVLAIVLGLGLAVLGIVEVTRERIHGDSSKC